LGSECAGVAGSERRHGIMAWPALVGKYPTEPCHAAPFNYFKCYSAHCGTSRQPWPPVSSDRIRTLKLAVSSIQIGGSRDDERSLINDIGFKVRCLLLLCQKSTKLQQQCPQWHANAGAVARRARHPLSLRSVEVQACCTACPTCAVAQQAAIAYAQTTQSRRFNRRGPLQ
jgi:hypothetical protein